MFKNSTSAFLIFDGAANPELNSLFSEEGIAAISLFEGTRYKDSKLFGPFLVVDPDPAFIKKHWEKLLACKLLAFAANQPKRNVIGAWKSLICSRLENGEHILLRAYDPVALSALLPTCDVNQLNSAFAFWSRIYATGMAKGLWCYSWQNNSFTSAVATEAELLALFETDVDTNREGQTSAKKKNGEKLSWLRL